MDRYKFYIFCGSIVHEKIHYSVAYEGFFSVRGDGNIGYDEKNVLFFSIT